jgi:hypothetical protein
MKFHSNASSWQAVVSPSPLWRWIVNFSRCRGWQSPTNIWFAERVAAEDRNRCADFPGKLKGQPDFEKLVVKPIVDRALICAATPRLVSHFGGSGIPTPQAQSPLSLSTK